MDFIKSDKFILPIVYVILGVIFYGIVKFVIGKVSKNKYINKKKMTIISLIKNIVKCLVCVFVVLSILSVYGVDTSGILASLGIAGLVIGLALQDIIADFVAGIFILFDNQYSIGDTVKVNGFMGEVISFGLMSTKIKAYTGEILIISNSSFKEVINYSLENTGLYIDICVDYDTDIDKLEEVLKNMEEDVLKMENVIGNYKLLGISEFADSCIKYLVSVECKANCHYQVRRDFYKLIKINFDKVGIVIPYNKIDVNVLGSSKKK